MTKSRILFRKWMLVMFLTTLSHVTSAQKLIIDSLAVVNWPSISTNNVIISDDGSYFSYTIENQPRGSTTRVIQRTDNSWSREFVGVSQCWFSIDNKQALFQRDDTLFSFLLTTMELTWVLDVTCMKFSENGKWVAYNLKNS